MILDGLFGQLVKKRNKRFESGKAITIMLGTPVISIGNISVGGTGKTPFVIELTRMIKQAGFKPAIIGLGYKRKTKGIVIVSDGKKILADSEQAGDEMLLIAEKTLVPVIVHEKKYIASKEAEDKFAPDVILVDDGFQHRHLERDCDIVLIDRTTLEKPFLLPKGRLREPLESLQRANVICMTGNVTKEELFQKIKLENKIIIKVESKSEKPYNSYDGKSADMNLLSKENAIAVCGIANPGRFTAMLGSMGLNVGALLKYKDHISYTKQIINTIISNAKSRDCHQIFTTEKDNVKLKKYGKEFANNHITMVVFPISLEITEGKENFEKYILNIIRLKNESRK